MAVIRVATEGLDQVLGQFNALPSQIERASKRAIAKGTQFAAREVRRGLAAKLKIPQKVLRDRKRIATKPGLVWIGIAPIKAVYLGKPRQTKTGVRVGSYFFAKAFVATMPTGHRGVPSKRTGRLRRLMDFETDRSGHVGIFRRVGKSRLPLAEVKVSLKTGEEIVKVSRSRIEEGLKLIQQQEIEYQLRRRHGAR